MASNGFLRTVRVGGFDKQDVLAYVDDLTSKIYTLEAQVNDQNETIERLEKSAGSAQKQDFEGKKELEKKVEEAKNKVAELMASTDTMKVRIADYEQQIGEKDAEIERQKNEIEELRRKSLSRLKRMQAAAEIMLLLNWVTYLSRLRIQLISSLQRLRLMLRQWKRKLRTSRTRYSTMLTPRLKSSLHQLRLRLILHSQALSRTLLIW